MIVNNQSIKITLNNRPDKCSAVDFVDDTNHQVKIIFKPNTDHQLILDFVSSAQWLQIEALDKSMKKEGKKNED